LQDIVGFHDSEIKTAGFQDMMSLVWWL